MAAVYPIYSSDPWAPVTCIMSQYVSPVFIALQCCLFYCLQTEPNEIDSVCLSGCEVS